MLKSKISRRLIFSFLLITITSLSLLGMYLLQFFYNENLKTKTENLLINARTIEVSLEDALYNPAKQDYVNNEIHKISDTTNLRITIIKANGQVIADSWEQTEELDNHLLRLEVQDALHNEYGTSIRYSDTIKENMLYAAMPVYQNDELAGIVRVASTLYPIENSYNHIRNTIFTALCITIILAVLAGFILAHRQIKPIRQMTEDAQKIADGDLDRRIYIYTNDELEVLAQTINKLTTNLEEKISEADAETRKLSLILENMDNGVMLLDTQGNITTANRRARDLFRLTPDLMKKQSINAIGSTLLSETAKEVLKTRSTKSIAFKININHTKKTFDVFFAPIMNSDNTVISILSVFHDISVLQEMSTRQTEFVANASHELATPLTSICGFSETLLSGALKDPILCEKFITIIHTESQRMDRLIKDLLQLAKLDSKEYRQQIKIESVDLKEVCMAVKLKLQSQIDVKSQKLQLNLPVDPVIVQANTDWIMQLLMNLTENAIKYTPAQGQITLTCTLDQDKVFVKVKDNGLGIAPEDLPFIFERFYRADKSRTRLDSSGGSGIGLSLVRFIVELFGGQIFVESQLKVGTSFTFHLPK